MKKRLCAGGLSLALLLSGCSGMLERSYARVTPHSHTLSSIQTGSALEAQTYQQLVSAILYLVTHHREDGIIRLYNYTGDPEDDVARACLEVLQKDPLGAFAVEQIKQDVSRIVSFYEAEVDITYLRTAEEMARITSVTGSSAIKQALRDTISRLDNRQLLRISYFSGDETYLTNLIRQAYYDTPLGAFGTPEVQLSFYPESGIQRIVEVDLTYPIEQETLLLRQQELAAAADLLLGSLSTKTPETLYEQLRRNTDFGPGGTAYDALIGGQANGEGFALAYKLLCDRAGLTCTVVQGSGERPFWNIVTTSSGSRHVDCAAGLFGYTDHQLEQIGKYVWSGSYPLCRDGSELN